MNSMQKTLFIFLTTLVLGLAAYFYTNRETKIEDVQINITSEYLAPGSVRFEGTIINTGDRDIEECTIAAKIWELKFYDEALSNCKLVSTIAKVRNLKARETRLVVWYFNSDNSDLENIPKGYNNNEPFTYTASWANCCRWRVFVASVK
jgi:hypothetical protein